jgi:hypothetical protein
MFLFHKYLLIYLFSMYELLYNNHFFYHRFYTFINYDFFFENQFFNSLPQIYFIKLLTFYNNLFFSSESVSKNSKHPFIYT